MRTISQHRRLQLLTDDAMPSQGRHLFTPPACHKGDASTTGATTTSNQSGAQTQGVNGLTGGNGASPVVTTTAGGSPVTVGGSNNVLTTTDDGAVEAADELIQNVLGGVQSSVDSAATDSAAVQIAQTQAQAAEAVTDAAAQNSSGGTITIGGQTFSSGSVLLAIAALGAVTVGALILRKK